MKSTTEKMTGTKTIGEMMDGNRDDDVENLEYRATVLVVPYLATKKVVSQANGGEVSMR
jgi:hypothetical protein